MTAKRQVTWRDRLRYAFDNSMTAGPIALIGWLAVVSLALIFVMAVVVSLLRIGPPDSDGYGVFEAAWLNLMRTLDAGTMGGDEGWSFRLAMLLVTLGGIFVVSTLIGVLTSGIESRLDELRKGRSFVLERDHTLILGWSPKIFTVISELVVANENRHKPRVVVLADRDKVAMEDELRDKLGPTGKTRVVCRTGNPVDLTDLAIVNPQESRSIIVLGPEGAGADLAVIKTVLALTSHPERRREPYHIVAELADARSLEAARLVGRGEAQFIVSGELISRITVQTCRQSGLSVVYSELLDFDGDEIYFQPEPALVGKTFGAALLAYEESSVLGLQHPDGRVALNPAMDTPLVEGSKIIAISRDDDTVKVSGRTDVGIDEGAIRVVPRPPARPERMLILGWNERVPFIVRELDRYVAPGSHVEIVADTADAEGPARALADTVQQTTIAFRQADITERRVLDALDVASFEHVLVLCSTLLDVQEADARTLITLLHLRQIADQADHPFTIVSEMLDLRNRDLAEVAKADDFIVSDKLSSLLLAQVSENRQLSDVFADIFDADGSEIYLRPAGEYVETGRPVNFYTVVESARRRSEVAIGYRRLSHASDASKAYGVVINPPKSAPIVFDPNDRVIVVSES